jgi:G3E family GTPase
VDASTPSTPAWSRTLAEKLPVVVVTGFLGSGKTTLISSLLRHPALGETAVIVNELGEVAIDHHLLRRVDERTVVLDSGCVCCSLRGDLADELRDLLSRRTRGEIPPFARVVVETTGLADPAPVVYTLLSEPVVRHHYSLESVVATVDGVNGMREPESVKQAAVADRLVVTKTDVADRGSVCEVEERLARLNPTAPIIEAVFGAVEPDQVFGGSDRDLRELSLDGHAHREDLHAVAVFLDDELDWSTFAVWLTMLLQARGSEILRVKGLLNVGGGGPVLLNCVQHAVHSPEHLESWPDEDHRSRLVFIGRGFEREQLEASLRAFNRAGQ